MTGLSRRRIWRRLVIAWAVTVVVAGLLTLWLQDSAAPPPPTRWENAPPSDQPAPRDCPDGEGHTVVVCAWATLGP
ncbi:MULTISPECIES: hypothetical protein [unclassified Streptomyces]|jgi:hypothetical protein|uniref:hypothetical protein n=1 Tax=unclassified Streptomyces TaxID=2593676 RepID=UPI00114F2950|nr:hypothetical protein [Streptomyces sp. SLBN-31]TQJ89914.1 hypothetical protein FBY22_0680 [Streptomyces sp. SLBN-31]